MTHALSFNSEAATLSDLLREGAERHPHRLAYVFVRDSEGLENSLTYLELYCYARAAALQLIAHGVEHGDRVVLLFPSGLDFIKNYFGCLCAGAVAVPVYPPLKDIRPLENIVADCSPKLILSCEQNHDRVRRRFADSALMTGPRWHVPDLALDSSLQHLQPVGVNSIAMLQYTSGSTSAAKGVTLTHRNLMANLFAIQQRFGGSPESVVVSWLPMYHDMGLIGGVLGVLYSGACLYFMAPQDFVQEPFRWLHAISRYKATISGGPNFAYQLAINRITPQQMAKLDLQHWQVAFNGAEPIRPQVLQKFAEKFGACRFDRSAFLPCYGMAEASVLVSSIDRKEIPRARHISKRALQEGRIIGTGRDSADAMSIVSCGEVIDGHTAVIVDPNRSIARMDNEVGEIWISGPSVAQRYWNAHDGGSAAIDARLDGDTANVSYHRTGDLGFIQDGHLFVVGRLKEVIILRGRNYYPQDIELLVAQSHSDLQIDGGAAFEVDGQDGAELVLVQEVRRSAVKNLNSDEIARSIREAVSQCFQIEVQGIVLISPRRLPRTSSGKVQRSFTKQLYLSEQLQPLATCGGRRSVGASSLSVITDGDELSPLEQEIRTAVARVVELDSALISCTQPLLNLNIDSLLQLQLTHVLKTTYGYEINIEQYFDGLTIRGIADGIAAHRAKHANQPAALDAIAICAAANENDPPLSEASDDAKASAALAQSQAMQVSLMFFSSDGSARRHDKYELVMQCAKFADNAGFASIWLPERHFHRFGGLYPNPAVLGAAVAATTSCIRIRAGSVIIPLHDPIRVAEEWSMVDNLSGGRVDLSFGQGWNPNDFVLAPDAFPKRLAQLYKDIDTVRTLWSSRKIERRNGLGNSFEFNVFPPPVQDSLNVWITCSGGVERFAEAGACGVNILTAMLFQDRRELAEKLDVYRDARARHGHDPSGGHVTLMLHTFLGEDMAHVRSIVRQPLMRYLEDSIDLWRQNFDKLKQLQTQDKQHVIEFAFERYFRSHSLCGTVDHCMAMIADLRAIGVNEIACLIDFGVPAENVLSSLHVLERLNGAISTAPSTYKTLALGQ